ncbi:Ribosome-binding factor A [Planctomycetales bacterium 10988]|nr:Ribosome-binding factor A [Planctomycetales bacterium 10988]
MTSRRLLKMGEAVRKAVGSAIYQEVQDPRVRNVTITKVEVAPDMRTAKVHVSIMGDEQQEQRCLQGLKNAAGFLQSKIARQVETRYTPRLEFVLDKGIKNSLEVAKILREVLPQGETSSENDPEPSEEGTLSEEPSSDLSDPETTSDD